MSYMRRAMGLLVLGITAAGCSADVGADANEAAAAESVGSSEQALDQYPYSTVKDVTVPFKFTSIMSITVNAGETLTVTATANEAETDPYLAAYYLANGNNIKVVGLSDDAPNMGRNSKIVWTNNTGATQSVYYVSFAYSDSSNGTARVTASTPSHSNGDPVATIGGSVVYWNNLYPNLPNCSRREGNGFVQYPQPYLSTRFKTYGNPSNGWVMQLALKTSPNNAGGLATAKVPNTSTSMELQTPNYNSSFLPEGNPLLVFSPHPNVSGTIRMTQEENRSCPVGL